MSILYDLDHIRVEDFDDLQGLGRSIYKKGIDVKLATENHGPDGIKRKMKMYALIGSTSLVCLFIGLYMGIMLLALKATEIFEGAPPLSAKEIWLWTLFAVFNLLSVVLGIAVFRGIRNSPDALR